MERLKIKADKDNPEVFFDGAGRLFMGGASLPENPKEFFDPILQWIEMYKKNAQSTTYVEFRFEYLNTASTFMMARIIESLADIQKARSGFSLTWYYPCGDYDMRELGEELLERTDIKYTILEEDQ